MNVQITLYIWTKYLNMKNLSSLFKFKPTGSSGLFIGILIGILVAFGVQKIPFSKNLAAGIIISSANGSSVPVCGLNQMPYNNNVYGLTVTEMQYNEMTTAYKNAHPNTGDGVTWGGVIGKNHLIAIINSLGNDGTEVNFKFITNSANQKTSLIFQGGAFNPVNGNPEASKLFIRTGTAPDAFCPSRCQ